MIHKQHFLNSSRDGVYFPQQNLVAQCDDELVKFPVKDPYAKNDDGEYIYIQMKQCPNILSATVCYRRACNCDDRIDTETKQPVSIRDVFGWQCFAPEPLETFNTMFLSPSPMLYAVDKNSDAMELGAKWDQLEISFGQNFVSLI